MSQRPPKVIPIQPEASQALFKSEPKVHPRSVTGIFNNWRWIMVWVTQIIFYGLCWLPWNGRQAVLFDLEARRFYLFDLVLWPQDTIYLAILLVLSALALFLFTAVAGRLWCGYTCPQTVYTEIFLWVEKLLEGERPQRIKLDAAPWSADKLRRKVAKHGIWIAFSLWTGFTFVGYFTPIRNLLAATSSFTLGPWEIFWVLFYGGFTYGFAGFLREQMCKYICPYARFQFVMFDADTLIITYDEARGEPRGSRSRKADPASLGLGSCIDCGICVQVCPTGIDIRNGIQAECIGCAACIDACDQVMDQMHYPRGLIRYSTENALQQRLGRAEIIRRAFRPRTLIYGAVFFCLTLGTAWSLATRVPLKVEVERDRSVLAREVEGGMVENVFRLQLSNASEAPRRFQVRVEGLPGMQLAEPLELQVAAAGNAEATVRVRVPPEAAPAGGQPMRFLITDLDDPGVAVAEKASFWMP
ncbi:cytochrome c oxidase accessory protein CcoG [Azovibrio restrictus]|uniref:cytochrome c oxidase accessory protein CcoG n=1 Tax=Azovibrio restrictus TaxID=146938 RepID=UPI0026F21D33|nr:cytochrome c oxidase accessory protein CcoG [Azovibrio restrictus]MDD3484989.1 cytochrome c oxidase accessory protein CcoG [Azovibrio restrictus]